MKFLIGVVAATYVLAAAPAGAQTYGSVSLSPGFEPDPVTVSIEAGGSLDATQAHPDCKGFVADPPDYVVQWSGGSNLTIAVASDADTTLFILAPGDNIACDDDSGGDSNPAFVFGNAAAGVYQIWVGTYNAGPTQPATLIVTERVQPD